MPKEHKALCAQGSGCLLCSLLLRLLALYSKEFVLLCQEIYRIGLYNTDQTPNPPGKSNMIEKDLSELNKSNMFYAYNKIKTRL